MMKDLVFRKESLGPCCAGGVCVTSADPWLEIRQLSVRYGTRYAFQDVSASISPCSVTALIGPSGCGKTSFLSCFNRLIDLIPGCRASGSILWNQEDILSPSTHVRSLRTRIGMVFQKPNPFPLSIRKNIILPLKEHGYRDGLEHILETSLRDVGLWDEVKDRLHSPALALSGGQQQRLCIARCLALKPEMILFDEPCSALDPMSSAVVEDLIQSLRHRCAVMIVTHNLAQARRVADDVGVFWNDGGHGRLIEFGKAQQIFEDPRHRHTAAYISGLAG